MDPSGTYIECQAKAIGAASEGAQQSLKEQYHTAITLSEAMKKALGILKQVMEEKLSAANIEVAKVTAADGFHLLTKDELEELVRTL